MPVASPKVAKRKPEASSRVTNGREILPGVDGRSLVARRFRDISSAIVADQGGNADIAEARLQLIRRFAAAAVLAETMEADLANGAKINIAEHALLCSSLVRIGARIGINRHAREIVPTLSQYLEAMPQAEDDG